MTVGCVLLLFAIGNGKGPAATNDAFWVNNFGGVAATSYTAQTHFHVTDRRDAIDVGAFIPNKLGTYFAERSADITALGERVLDKLVGKEDLSWPSEPFVLVTDNLGPLEMVKLQSSSIVGLVTSLGSPTSHTSILARGMNLPTVVSVSGTEFVKVGDQLIVDSSSGQILVNPDVTELDQYIQALPSCVPEILGSSVG